MLLGDSLFLNFPASHYEVEPGTRQYVPVRLLMTSKVLSLARGDSWVVSALPNEAQAAGCDHRHIIHSRFY